MKKILLLLSFAFLGLFKANAQNPTINSDSTTVYCNPILQWVHLVEIENLLDTGKIIKTLKNGTNVSIDTISHDNFTFSFKNIETSITTVGTYEISFVLWDKDYTIAYDSFTHVKTFNSLICNYLFVAQYLDMNNDCAYQQESMNAPNIAMYKNGTLDRIINNVNFGWDDNTIKYFDYQNGDSLIFKVHNPIYQTCLPNAEKLLIVDTNPMSGTIYFPFNLSDSLNWAVNMFPMLRTVAGISTVKIDYANLAIDSGSATINFTVPNDFQFDSTTASSYTQTGNVVTFNVSNVIGGQSYSFLIYLMNQDSMMILGDSVLCSVEILPKVGDIDTSNNTHEGYFLLRSSYDPNQKTTLPHILLNEPTQKINYLIEFENLGNDTAFNVSIIDTLSDLLDMSTLEITASSHEYSFINTGNNGLNILNFSFPNIGLADSTDKKYNKGFISYTIAPKAILTLQDTIYNTAHIYFDNNPAIVTNTSTNHLKPVSIHQIDGNWNVKIYPNPVKNQLIIEQPDQHAAHLVIYSVIGQKVMEYTLKNGNNFIDVAHLNQGIYIVTCMQDGIIKTFKLLKQ